jgi:enoyl-CoA hydratase
MGLVNRIVPLDSLKEETLKTAKMIAAKGKVSLRAAKQAVNNGLNVDLATGCRIEMDAFAICMASEDAKEGTSAFLEKRKGRIQRFAQEVTTRPSPLVFYHGSSEPIEKRL